MTCANKAENSIIITHVCIESAVQSACVSKGWLLLGQNPTGTDVPRSTCADSPSALKTTLFASLVHAAQKRTEARLSRESRLIPITKEFPP